MSAYQNLFDKQSQDYSRFRPPCPKELISFIMEHVTERNRAWDAGCGSGQVAIMLAEEFEQVHATDSSEAQIAQAYPHAKIEYRVTASENCRLADASCDLITAGNAVHWFDREKFYSEARRVAKPNALIAVWCHGWLEVPDTLKELVGAFYKSLDPYWPLPIKLVSDRYQTLEFPFEEIEAPVITRHELWTLERILGFYSTWSAVQKFKEEKERDPVAVLQKYLESDFKLDKDSEIATKLQHHLRVGRIRKE